MCVCVYVVSVPVRRYRSHFLTVSVQWTEHHAALSRLAVGQTLMVNQLVDMEWKFGGETSVFPSHIHERGGSNISIADVLPVSLEEP